MKYIIKSKTNRNKNIIGELTKSKNTENLVIFMSGLTGSKEFLLFKKAKKYFIKNYFNVFTFDFCNDEKKSKKNLKTFGSKDLSFSFYISELKNIVDNFNNKYKKIILVGHSFGAIVCLLFLNKYKKYIKKTDFIIWDPSLLPWTEKAMIEDFYFDKNTNLYRGKTTDEIMNVKFYNETIETKDTSLLIKNLKKPLCIIYAENGARKEANKYFEKIKNDPLSKLVEIKKTGHHFNGSIAQNNLFKETINFLVNLDKK